MNPAAGRLAQRRGGVQSPAACWEGARDAVTGLRAEGSGWRGRWAQAWHVGEGVTLELEARAEHEESHQFPQGPVAAEGQRALSAETGGLYSKPGLMLGSE